MEIYKDLSNPGVKEFESLLDSQLSKAKILNDIPSKLINERND